MAVQNATVGDVQNATVCDVQNATMRDVQNATMRDVQNATVRVVSNSYSKKGKLWYWFQLPKRDTLLTLELDYKDMYSAGTANYEDKFESEDGYLGQIL